MKYHFFIRDELPKNFIIEADEVEPRVNNDVPVVVVKKDGKECAVFFADALIGYMPKTAVDEGTMSIGFERAD